MHIGDVPVGGGSPLVLICGLNVIESEAATLECARTVQLLAEKHGLALIFKASFDKANRSSLSSYRGPGLDEGLRVLAAVKRDTGLPITSDVHEPHQAKIAAGVVDLLQVPSFLCRQTDLLLACAATGRPVNLKKGQFLAPDDMRHAVRKVASATDAGVMVTERGTTFGYRDLVVDMEALAIMRAFAPVCFDATHSVQRPGGVGESTGGDRRFVPALARAAVAVGIDALFVETHPEPDQALCDGPSQIAYDALDRLLGEVCAIERALRRRTPGGES